MVQIRYNGDHVTVPWTAAVNGYETIFTYERNDFQWKRMKLL